MSEQIPEIPFDKPESIDALVEAMTPTIYENLKTAVELGKWGDGARLSPEQVESFCRQLFFTKLKIYPRVSGSIHRYPRAVPARFSSVVLDQSLESRPRLKVSV